MTRVVLSLFKGLIEVPDRNSPSTLVMPEHLQDALDAAAIKFQVSHETILSKSRRQQATDARQYAAWLLRQHKWANGKPRFSRAEIGLALGIDQQTVWNAIKRVDDRLGLAA